MPLPALRREEKAGRVLEAEAAERAAERQEHWRLLYVAMTRAIDALFIGGALGKREKEPAPDSWYARLAQLIDAEPLADDVEHPQRVRHAVLGQIELVGHQREPTRKL